MNVVVVVVSERSGVCWLDFEFGSKEVKDGRNFGINEDKKNKQLKYLQIKKGK